MRNQASAFLIERTSLEKIIKEQQANIMEYQIKIRSFEEELEIWRIQLKEKEAYISKIEIEISAHKQGDEQTISDLRFHYEEMIKYQEVYISFLYFIRNFHLFEFFRINSERR